jgi:focal adhesion kinase 1
LDFSIIEEEGGLLRYLPESIVVSTKKKQLQKSVINAVRKVVHLSELECVFKFMKQLMSIARFDTEIFRVSFGTGWQRPVELYVGQHYGIAYKNENTKEPVILAELRNVVDVGVKRLNSSTEQCIVRIKISGNPTPMIVTTSTINMAESLAHLIDGYQMILSQQASVWTSQGVI